MPIHNIPVVQPPVRDGELFEAKRYHSGSERSKDKLRTLRYDPIEKLVNEHNYYTELLTREEKVRDGLIVNLNPNTGKVLIWRPDFMMKLLELRQNVADKLLRYGYGRVPETNTLETQTIPPLIINTTKKGEVYHTGEVIDNDED